MGLFRLALALSVLLGHYNRGFFGLGFVTRTLAVQCFFIISGFYMALILTEKYTGPGRYGIFIQQRFLRLYPTYLILAATVLGFDFAISEFTGSWTGDLKKWAEFGHLLSPGATALYVATNLLIPIQDLVTPLFIDGVTGHLSYFPTGENPIVPSLVFYVIPPSWSLAVEFLFYFLAPFLVCRPIRDQVLVLLASAALRIGVILLLGVDSVWVYSWSVGNFGLFMAGSIGYALYARHRTWVEAKLPSYRWTFLVFAIFVATYSRLPFAHQLYFLLIPTVCVMVPLLFNATRNNRFDRLVGELSYPFYLIHFQVVEYFHNGIGVRLPQWLQGPLCAVITGLLAWMFYRFIESRFERYRESVYRNSRFYKAVAVAPIPAGAA